MSGMYVVVRRLVKGERGRERGEESRMDRQKFIIRRGER